MCELTCARNSTASVRRRRCCAVRGARERGARAAGVKPNLTRESACIRGVAGAVLAVGRTFRQDQHGVRWQLSGALARVIITCCVPTLGFGTRHNYSEMTAWTRFALLETTFVGVLARASAGWTALCRLNSGLVAWRRRPCSPRSASFTTSIFLHSAHGNSPLTGTATPMRHTHVGLDFTSLASWPDLAEAA